MSERIKQLAEQAEVGYVTLKREYAMTPDLEYFAELIIKDTMQVVANNLPQNVYYGVANAVIEHFGLKK